MALGPTRGTRHRMASWTAHLDIICDPERSCGVVTNQVLVDNVVDKSPAPTISSHTPTKRTVRNHE